MTPEAQRIAIATTCGVDVPCGGSEPERIEVHQFGEWKSQSKPVPFQYRQCSVCGATHIQGERHAQIDRDRELPDYLNDLNACHEMEKTIDQLDWPTYTMQLRRLIQRDCDKPECYLYGTNRAQLIADFWFYHATGAQRAEAFLRMKGLWKEEEFVA